MNRSDLLIVLLVVLIKIPFYSNGNWSFYNMDSGLTDYHVNAIADDVNNNLWISVGSNSGTFGLDMYDGLNWSHYNISNSGLQSNAINHITSDNLGVLWISHMSGSGLTKFDGQNWVHFNTTNSGIPSNYIIDMQIDEDNNLWLLCSTGLSKYDGANFTNYPINFHVNFSAAGFVVEDSSSIWIATGGLMHYNPITDSITMYDETNSNIPSIYSDCIGIDTNGIIWMGFNFQYDAGAGIGLTNGGLATFDGISFTTVWPFNSTYTGVYDLCIGQDNKVWVSTRCEGLYVFDGYSWTRIPDIPQTSCSFNVFVDRMGYTWYGSLMGFKTLSGLWTNRPLVNITENEINDIINFYPNPAQSQLCINFENTHSEASGINIYNSIGKLVYSLEYHHRQESEMVIDISGWSEGLYIVKLKSENRVVSDKFIIQR